MNRLIYYYFNLIGPFFYCPAISTSKRFELHSVMLRVPKVRITKTTIMPPKHTPETELKGRAS